ncbi:MAG TPA: hypothetical protein VIU64_09515 [Polyangia bacterium]
MTKTFLAILTMSGVAVAMTLACDPNPPLRIAAKGSGGSGVNPAGSGGTSEGSGGTTSGSGGTTSGSGGMAEGSGGEMASSGGSDGSGGAAGDSAGGETGSTGGSTSSGGETGAGGSAPGGAGGRSGGGIAGRGGGGGPGPMLMPVEVIDDFDDGDGRITMMGERQGPWHSFNDTNGGNQTPPNTMWLPESGGANGTPHAAHTKGSGYKFGGIGFDLNNATTMPESMQCMAYDGSMYKGITFWAKGTANLRVEFPTKAFVPTTRGGSCNESSSTCWNVYGSRAPQKMLTADWKQFTIPFSTLEREMGGTTPPFDPTQLMGISFKSESDSFDFWIDDVEFAR